MNRRDFFKLAGLTGAFSLFPSNSLADDLYWRVSFGLNGFESGTRKYQKNYPIWEVLDFGSRNGFDGVELVTNWPAGDYPKPGETSRIRALRRLHNTYGLQIFSIQLGADQAFDPDRSKRKAWLQDFQERVDLAHQLGCDCVGIWPGGGLRGQTIGDAINRLAESLHSAAEIAAKARVLAAFEIEPPFVFNTEEHLKAILEKVNHRSMKTIFDPSHFDLMSGSTGRPHEMLHRIGVENIGYVHLTDSDGTLRDGGTSKHLACGDGHIDIQSSLMVLKEGGFRGWINIDTWEIPDPYDACRKGKFAVSRVS